MQKPEVSPPAGVRRGEVPRRVNGDRGAKNPAAPAELPRSPGWSTCPPHLLPPYGQFFSLTFLPLLRVWGGGSKIQKRGWGYERYNGGLHRPTTGHPPPTCPRKFGKLPPPPPPGSNPMNVDTIRLGEGGEGTRLELRVRVRFSAPQVPPLKS